MLISFVFTRRGALVVATALALAGLALAGGTAPAAPIPGYRLLTTWPADTHGLQDPRAVATGADGRIWLLDGAAAAAVALNQDGSRAERRTVPSDALDLAVGADGHLYFGRKNPRNRRDELPYSVSRHDEMGRTVWQRECECGTGSGIAWTSGRVWTTDPARRVLRWHGEVDGRVTGELASRTVESGFPADVDASPDGSLFATDLLGRAVHVWRPPYSPGRVDTWTMAEASGPFRIGAGSQSDGEIVVAVMFPDGLVRVHRPDGSLVARFHVPGEPADIAVGDEGRLYVLDAEDFGIRVFVPGTPPTPTPPPPDPPLVAGSCVISGTRTVRPPSLGRCGLTQVSLHLDATCPPGAVTGADVVLVIDRSLSMITGQRLKSAQAAARRFLAGLDMQAHRASIVSYNRNAVVEQGLTTDLAALNAAVDSLTPEESYTHIQAGVQTAMRHIEAAGRPDALPVLIVLTDGAPNLPLVPEPATAALASAEWARGRRAYIVTIGIGRHVNSLLLESMASTPADFYYSPLAVDLERIYDTILDVVGSIGITDLVISDQPRTGAFEPVAGSARPPALLVDGAQRWTRPALPDGGLVFTHTIKALAPGASGIGEASVRYVDADGTRRTWRFPEPRVDVAGPSAVPGTPGGPPVPPTATLPAPPRPSSCPPGAAHHLALSVYPDTSGFGPYDCPGCSGRFRSADHWSRGAWRETGVVEVRDGTGGLLWIGDVGATPQGAGYVSVSLCAPPPYRVTLLRTPPGYVSCPNSPASRRIDREDLHLGDASIGFALWKGCGRPSATPPPALAPCP